MMFDSMFPIASKIIKTETIFSSIIFIKQPILQPLPLLWINNTFKDRILDSLSKSQTCFCDSPEPPATLWGDRCHIIADQNKHDACFLLLFQQHTSNPIAI